MGSLKKCPECHGDFKRLSSGILICKICGYWTKENTARMDSMMLYEEAMLCEGGL
ncbi:hypothetical protein RE474_00300 [Methanolobus sediminis]|uniref:Uncharacterized protein n=1 Tax=Methanolobus sediminis TaxID=3072978 RepID=A0AA51UKD9_9EURY|nr:hypothetical protein [Methanolobus sediminis]WMW25193.1 hypothetical protein RE474_00300 [Methanolobus sediminis]